MKDESSLARSASAVLNAIISNTAALNAIAKQQKSVGFTAERMQFMRSYAESIAQNTHEYSAYNDALNTE